VGNKNCQERHFDREAFIKFATQTIANSSSHRMGFTISRAVNRLATMAIFFLTSGTFAIANFSCALDTAFRFASKGKLVSARRQHKHVGRMRYQASPRRA
jgi:hypothetical protein